MPAHLQGFFLVSYWQPFSLEVLVCPSPFGLPTISIVNPPLNHWFGSTNYLMLQFFFGAPAAAPLPALGGILAQETQDEHQVLSSLAPTVTRYDEGNHLSPIHAARATSPAPVHVPRVTAQAPAHTHAPHATAPAPVPRIRGHHHHLHPGWVFTLFLNFFCLYSRLHSVANMVMHSCLWSIIDGSSCFSSCTQYTVTTSNTNGFSSTFKLLTRYSFLTPNDLQNYATENLVLCW